MKLIKICIGTWENASRDKRELSVCKELGYEVNVLAKGNSDDRGRREEGDGFDVLRYTTRPLKNAPLLINRLLSILIWAKFVRKLKPDIISGHDLEGLTIAWISSLFLPAKCKPKLVYDSHEFELGRYIDRGIIKWNLVRVFEKYLINRCTFSMMVNDSIADEVMRIHHLKERPIVVRNIPNYWHIDEFECQKMREKILSRLDGRCKILMMYHGMITRGRGIEKLLQVVADVPDVGIALVGHYTEEYIKEIYQEIQNKDIVGKVFIHDAIPIEDLWKYIGAADVGMVTIPPITRSYYYCLPNKLFENIQAMTPVIVTNLPEMRRLVERYEIGWICEDSVEDIKKVINSILDNPKSIIDKVSNLCEAKKKLCWENEKKILINAYRDLLQGDKHEEGSDNTYI